MGTLYKRAGQPKWQLRWQDENGQAKYKALSVDKQVARKMQTDIERDVERRKAGLADKFTDAAKLPIARHVADYKAHLTAKGGTAKHVGFSLLAIERIVAGCGFKRIPDMEPLPCSGWLSKHRAGGNSIRNSNAHLTAVKGFSKWLWESGRTADHRLVSLKPLNEELDERHQRRSLADADFRRLLEVTKASTDTVRDFDGYCRWLLYLLAGLTGLRANECTSLTVGDLNLDESSFSIVAKNTKARKAATLGLHEELCKQLAGWITSRGLSPADRLFGNIPNWFRYADMLKHDLAAANIPYCQDGRYFDFHAIRGQCATMLERAGVSLKKAQDIMRHSTPALTAKYYSRPDLSDLTAAVNRVSLSAIQPQQVPKLSA